MASKKVTFKKTDWQSVVKTADPKPTREVEYQFSNGRRFLSRKTS